jgi:hypothetical protein
VSTYTLAQIDLMRRALDVGEPIVRGGAIEREYRCRHCRELLMAAILPAVDGLAETPWQRRDAEYLIVEHLRRPKAHRRQLGGCVRKPDELRSNRSSAAIAGRVRR